jgi:hypothetical protein
MPGIILLVLLFVGVRLVFQMVPPGVRSFLAEVMAVFFRFLFGTGNKGGR